MRPAEDGGSGAVVARPDGDPEALEHAAADLRGAAGTFGRVGGGLRQGGAVGGWEGLASFAFENRCITEASAVDSAAAACENAATVLNTLADDLRKAQKLCERAQDDATAAARRRAHARAEAEAARLDASSARTDASAATARADRREATGAPATEDRAAATASTAAAGRADTRAQTADRAAERAAADVLDAQAAAAKAVKDWEQHARDGARVLAALASVAPVPTSAGGLPIGGWGEDPTAPGLPLPVAPKAPSSASDEEDEGEEGVGGFLKGLGTGAWDGVKGIGDVVVMGVKSSPTTAIISPETFEEQWKENGDIAKAAYEHPGEFGKALINWDDLSNGNYGHWLGGLAPDAVAALATGGAGAAATRSASFARRAEDMADAGRALDKVGEAHHGLPPTSAFSNKTSAGALLDDPTLSGWKLPRPDGYQHVSPADVRAYADEIGHELAPKGALDQANRPDGFPGRWAASHAEKQAAIASPGTPLAVTKPMCADCLGFFEKHAVHTGTPQIVRDPDVLRMFMPDGRVLENPLPGATLPDGPSIHGPSAAGGAAGAQGAQGTSEYAGSHP